MQSYERNIIDNYRRLYRAHYGTDCRQSDEVVLNEWFATRLAASDAAQHDAWVLEDLHMLDDFEEEALVLRHVAMMAAQLAAEEATA